MLGIPKPLEKLALSKLKSTMQESEISLIAVTMKDGEIDFKSYTEPVLVISEKEFNRLNNLIKALQQ